MKQNLRLGIGLALATIGFGAPSIFAEGKYAPLVEALGMKKKEALLEAEDAELLAEGYEEFLEDPETGVLDRVELRKSLLQERARYQQERARAGRLQVAQRHLHRVPEDLNLTLAALKAAYEDLDALGARGKAAWDQVLADRATLKETLEEDYRRELVAAEAALHELKTAERASRILLDAIDTGRSGASDAEFHVALKFPSIKSAVELGFGITDRGEDLEGQAQATLLALIGYSQFYWDHLDGARDLLTDEEVPSDRQRNIFGVANGEILTSSAISHNESHYYYLSEEAKQRFNGKLRAIWGSSGTLTVNAWNQRYSDRFSRACRALATNAGEEGLLPNRHVFDLLEQIEALITEREAAVSRVEEIHSSYREQLREAERFGDEALLSTTSYNAELWFRESKELMRQFAAAEKLFVKELAASREEDWKPKTAAITAGAQIIVKAQKRLYAVRNVKAELADLLADSEPEAEFAPEPIAPVPAP